MTVPDIAKVVMPKWGLSMTTGKIMEWLVHEGDTVSRGDELVEIDTDKIAGALECDHDGVLRRIIAQVGESIPVGATIALLADPAVPDAELDAAVAQARADLDAGIVEEVAGPEIGSVEVDGRAIAYARTGESGPNIVLVHGYGGDKNSFLFVQEPLSEGYVVDAIDLPGHGDSTKDVGDGTLTTLADTVLGYLQAQGIERAHLVGHSLGGAVVTAAAAADPNRVASLTLIAPAGFGTEVNAGYLRGFAAAQSRRQLQPLLVALFADPHLVTRQLADDLMKFKRMDGVDTALAALLDTLLDGDSPALDLSASLAALSVPVEVVWGDQDGVLPVGNVTAVPAPGSVQRVAGVGHMVHMEKPAAVVEAVHRAVGHTG